MEVAAPLGLWSALQSAVLQIRNDLDVIFVNF